MMVMSMGMMMTIMIKMMMMMMMMKIRTADGHRLPRGAPVQLRTHLSQSGVTVVLQWCYSGVTVTPPVTMGYASQNRPEQGGAQVETETTKYILGVQQPIT